MSRYTELERLRLFLRYADRCARLALQREPSDRQSLLEDIILAAAGTCTLHGESEEEADMQAASLEKFLAEEDRKAAEVKP